MPDIFDLAFDGEIELVDFCRWLVLAG